MYQWCLYGHFYTYLDWPVGLSPIQSLSHILQICHFFLRNCHSFKWFLPQIFDLGDCGVVNLGSPRISGTQMTQFDSFGWQVWCCYASLQLLENFLWLPIATIVQPSRGLKLWVWSDRFRVGIRIHNAQLIQYTFRNLHVYEVPYGPYGFKRIHIY